MRFQRPPRPPSVLAGVLAAVGVVLAVAGCSHLAPLGPDSGSRPPVLRSGPVAVQAGIPVQLSHLRSPFVLEALRIQPTAAGGCPAGSVALSGGPGRCYRKLGTPVTITSAAVSSIFPYRPAPPSPGQQAGPSEYGFVIAVPAADQAALTAVTTTAANAHGYLSISIAGRTWLLPRVLEPFKGPQLMISRPSRDQALHFQRMLFPAG